LEYFDRNQQSETADSVVVELYKVRVTATARCRCCCAAGFLCPTSQSVTWR